MKTDQVIRFIIRGNIIMILNKNNQGVFLELLVAAKNNTFHFDQYSRLSIRLNIFRVSAKISKTNLKFEKSFSPVCRNR